MSLFEPITEGFVKRRPNENELEIPGLPWFSVSKGI